jgi:hypothetical protein
MATAPTMMATPMTAATFPVAQPYGADAPVSAPFGQSAPSVLGRRLLVDYKGSDPVGADTKGNGAASSVGGEHTNPCAHGADCMLAVCAASSLPYTLSLIRWHCALADSKLLICILH